MTSNDGTFSNWCRRDFSTVSLQPPPHTLPQQPPQPQQQQQQQKRPRQQQPPCERPSTTPQLTRSVTDRISEFVPPPGTKPYKRDPLKFDALSRTAGWASHSANIPGAQRAVYDPVSHTTTLYTFSSGGGHGKDVQVSRKEGKGDFLMRQKMQSDIMEGKQWHGRRKGVVEFVDRTHAFAVNSNSEFLASCESNPRVFHPKVGEMTNWMDNAFMSKMKVPFYGKHPYEMNR
eukprot:CAMPEP_0119302034 /NCGR_PEP_ID=MMETSP1333-20130426/3704_1 /TAXON_ID=418940 /ORGANISM="Scyphosphaera apsteinii, Strain RCC1455" /LENGTH=230 /DNA_ID=CAMNT_0007304269 /DNA_START=24 /DNA_END=716 /DNA_ORIENTATION=+